MTRDLDWTIAPPHPLRLRLNGSRPIPHMASKPQPSRPQPGTTTWPYRAPSPNRPMAVAVPRLRTVRVARLRTVRVARPPPPPRQHLLPAGATLRAIAARQGYPPRRLHHGWRSHVLGTLLAAAALLGLVALVAGLVLVLIVGVAGVGVLWTWVGR